jgi:hypothetical protein
MNQITDSSRITKSNNSDILSNQNNNIKNSDKKSHSKISANGQMIISGNNNMPSNHMNLPNQNNQQYIQNSNFNSIPNYFNYPSFLPNYNNNMNPYNLYPVQMSNTPQNIGSPFMPNFFPQNMPIIYNPNQMMNIPPLNNFNRPQNISVQQNLPIRLINPTISDKSGNQIIPTDVSKRSMSSKHRINSSRQNNSISNNNGPQTDSFSSRNRNNSYSKSNIKDYDGTYKPYTLKDYKEISSAKIILGSLGPNTGTKEWEERQTKLKKMEEYASNVQQLKTRIKPKKETPQENVEKIKKEKIENSNRYKSYEYSKLIKPKPKTSPDDESSYKVLGGIERTDHHILESDLKIFDSNVRYKEQVYNDNTIHRKMSDNINSQPYSKNLLMKNDNFSKNNLLTINEESPSQFYEGRNEILKLQNQRQAYNLKINEIKESLLK